MVLLPMVAKTDVLLPMASVQRVLLLLPMGVLQYHAMLDTIDHQSTNVTLVLMGKLALLVPHLYLPVSFTHVQTPTHHQTTATPEIVHHPFPINPHATQAATPATKDQANVVATPAPSPIPSLVQHVSMDNTKHKTLKPTHLVNFVQRVENLKRRHLNVQFVQQQNIKIKIQ